MRPLLFSVLALLPIVAQGAEKTRPIPLSQLPGLRIWNQGWVGTRAGAGKTVVFRQQIEMKNETPRELAAVSVCIVSHSPRGDWRGEPIRLTNFDNADVPSQAGLLPLSKSLEKRFDASMPNTKWTRDSWHELVLVEAEEFVNPDLHNLGHLFTRMINGNSASVIALLKKDSSLLKLRAASGLTTTLAAFAATDGSTMRWILAHGGDARARTVKGSTAMHLAAINGSGGVLALAPGGGANARAASGRTPLMKAIHAGNPTGWRWLLKHGANPNLGDKFGASPISYAIAEGQVPAIDDLIRAGVYPRKITPSGYGLMHIGLDNYLMLDKILSYGVSVDQRGPGGITPLMMAVRSGMEIHKVSWLLTHGANPRLKDAKGRTVAMYIDPRNGGREAFAALVRRYPKGAKPYAAR